MAPTASLTVDNVGTVAHDLKRKQALAYGGPVDHANAVSCIYDPAFDLRHTIFKTLRSPVKRYFQSLRMDAKIEWAAEAARRIHAAYDRVPRKLADDGALHRFMVDECDFALEHADGSFMDHLHFCSEYTALHLPSASPRVMLLHSIMGVGTNCFPMARETGLEHIGLQPPATAGTHGCSLQHTRSQALEKLPTLRSLVRDDEMALIQAHYTLTL